MLIFAEDISGAIAVLGILLMLALAMVVACRVAIIFLKQRRGEKPWWGLALGVGNILLGGAMLVMFLTTQGGAPTFCYLLSAVPVLMGVRCLLVWAQKPRD